MLPKFVAVLIAPPLHPDGCSDGSFPLTSNGGWAGGQARTDLLPLPLPAAPAWTLASCDKLFPPGQEVSKEGYEAGALAWLHLTAHARNYMYNGKASPNSDAPTKAPIQHLSDW